MTFKYTLISAIFKAASLASLTFALLQSSPKVTDGDAMLALLVIGIATSWCAGMYDTSGKQGYFLALLGLLLVLPAILACAFALVGEDIFKLAVTGAGIVIAMVSFASARRRFAADRTSMAAMSKAAVRASRR